MTTPSDIIRERYINNGNPYANLHAFYEVTEQATVRQSGNLDGRQRTAQWTNRRRFKPICPRLPDKKDLLFRNQRSSFHLLGFYSLPGESFYWPFFSSRYCYAQVQSASQLSERSLIRDRDLSLCRRVLGMIQRTP